MRPLAVAVVALVLAIAPLPAEDKGAVPHHDAHAAAFDDCAKVCGDCQRACDSCATHCAHLMAAGHKEHLQTLQTCEDCATHCAAAASITARKGPFADLICKACAEACARCGKACDQYPNDRHMKKCAEECRKCEKACREMLTHTGEKTTAR